MGLLRLFWEEMGEAGADIGGEAFLARNWEMGPSCVGGSYWLGLAQCALSHKEEPLCPVGHESHTHPLGLCF